MGITITINGEEHVGLPTGLSVDDLLEHLNLPKLKIAVERNREIVSKSGYAKTVLLNGDQLEIIHFIGGG